MIQACRAVVSKVYDVSTSFHLNHHMLFAEKASQPENFSAAQNRRQPHLNPETRNRAPAVDWYSSCVRRRYFGWKEQSHQADPILSGRVKGTHASGCVDEQGALVLQNVNLNRTRIRYGYASQIILWVSAEVEDVHMPLVVEL